METLTKKIIIVDDEPKRSRDWAAKIEALQFPGVQITALDLDDAKQLIQAAGHRRKEAREHNKDPFSSDIPCALDDVDVLVVDYDLQELLQEGHWSTGLQVASLARAFTKVKLITLVNQFGTNTFDLTLKKAVDSHADFDVGSDQLLNPSLWDMSTKSPFSPWSWQDGILKASERIADVAMWVAQHLDTPALTALGFTTVADEASTSTYISKELWQTWANDPDHTFRDIVKKSEFLTPKDREAIAAFDGPCSNVAATLLLHWLERWVIPANDVLIDLPHLAAANPWLLKDRYDPAVWELSTSHDAGFDALKELLQKHQYSPGFPLSRPVVWRNKITVDPELMEPPGFIYEDFPDLVFCEDTSTFEQFEEARPFSCQLPSSDTQRFVAGHKEVGERIGAKPFGGVLYEPSVFFSI